MEQRVCKEHLESIIPHSSDFLRGCVKVKYSLTRHDSNPETILELSEHGVVLW
jgi:hypothetical protein